MISDSLSDICAKFPILTDCDLQSAVRLNKFDELYRIIPLLGDPAADSYVSSCIVAIARIDRFFYIRANDIVDRIIREHPEYLRTFQRYLEDLITENVQMLEVMNYDWIQSTEPQTHYLFDLWADCIRRKLIKRAHYEGAVWKPTIMCIEITQQCNAACGHCASNSSPYTKIRLNPEKVREIVEQAAQEGIEYMGISGGEPFLEQRTLLETIRTATANGVFFDYINSNCFWAKTEEKAVSILQRIKEVTNKYHLKQHRGVFSISVTTEHLKWVPIENFVNVIRAHERVFPRHTLEMIGVRGTMFGEKQEPVFLRIIELLGDHVTRVDRDDEGKITRIYTKSSEIDVFFNYIVPIGRGEDMLYDDYEHYYLSEKELKKGLSALHVDGKVAQTITIGWDGKCAPDVVLKCSESVIAGNLYLKSFADVVRNGNNDPLIRGILSSVHRIINTSRRIGIFDIMQRRLRFHSSIQGYVSEFMKDPKKRLIMTIDLLREDIEAGQIVVDDRGKHIHNVNDFLVDVVEVGGEHLLPALRHLIRTFTYNYNFIGTTIRSNHLVVHQEGDHHALY